MRDKRDMVCRAFEISDEVDEYVRIFGLTFSLVQTLNVHIDDLFLGFVDFVFEFVHLAQTVVILIEERRKRKHVQVFDLLVHFFGHLDKIV